MAAGRAPPRGFADLDFLDWLSDEDVENNLWNQWDEIPEDDINRDFGGEPAAEPVQEEAQGAEGAQDAQNVQEEADDDGGDDGIVADAPDDAGEVEIRTRYIRMTDPRSMLYCTTMTYATIEIVGGIQYRICEGCYAAYHQRVPDGRHLHTDYHSTDFLTQGERGHCRSCRDRLYLIRPVEMCTICNSGKKTSA